MLPTGSAAATAIPCGALLQKQKVEAGDEVGSVQVAVEVVQKRMRTFDGSFVQFRCDEKGFLSICAFGLPGKTGENGPSRGLQAALSIAEGTLPLI